MPRVQGSQNAITHHNTHDTGLNKIFTPADQSSKKTCDLEARNIITKLTNPSQRIPGVNELVSKIASSKSWINDVIIALHSQARKNPEKFKVAKDNAKNGIDQKLNDLKNHTDKCGDDLNLETKEYIQWLKDKKTEIDKVEPHEVQAKPRRTLSLTRASQNPLRDINRWVGDRFNDAGKAVIDYSNWYYDWSSKVLNEQLKESSHLNNSGGIKPVAARVPSFGSILKVIR